MKITMTNNEMANYIELLSGCHETGKLGYAIARNLRRMKDAATEYLNLRADLFRKFGRPVDGDPGSVCIPKEHVEAFRNELREVADIAHDVDVFTVPPDVIWSGGLTSDQMSQMLWMVEES